MWSSVTTWSRIPRHAFIYIPRYKAVNWESARLFSLKKMNKIDVSMLPCFDRATMTLFEHSSQDARTQKVTWIPSATDNTTQWWQDSPTRRRTFFSGTHQALGRRYILLIYEKLISELEKSPKYTYETDQFAETSQVYSIVFVFKIKR